MVVSLSKSCLNFVVVILCKQKSKGILCVTMGFISPSETVRKILFHSLKIGFSVIDLSLLNFPATFRPAFLKGLSKSFSCSKQDPNLTL